MGEEHTCLLDDQGAVACFGDNGAGQISPGGEAQYHAPRRITGIPRASLLRCSGHGACVSSGNAITCFGENGAGPSTVELPGEPQDFVLYGNSGCAILKDHRVACWRPFDGRIVEAGEARGATALAVARVDSDRVCTTSGSDAPVCFDAALSTPVPHGVAPPPDQGPRIRGVARLEEFRGATELLWAEHPCALFADRHVTCTLDLLRAAWKDERTTKFVAINREFACLRGESGIRCGNVSWRPEDEPPSAVRAGVPAIADRLALSDGHGCAVASGSLTCWGRAGSGQLGDGTPYVHAAPVRVPGVDGAVSLAVGDTMACAVTRGGKLRCWGRPTESTEFWPKHGDVPRLMETPAPVQAVVIGTMYGPTRLCVRTEKDWRCFYRGIWDAAPRGFLGKDGKPVPTPHDDPAASVRDVTVPNAEERGLGREFGCARTTSGEVWCWGSNKHGTAPDGSPGERHEPVRVAWP